MYTHFRGSTFQFIGQLTDDGVPQDMTNATIVANVYDPSGTILYGNLTVTTVQLTNGTMIFSYPDTSNWPVGKARIDFQITFAGGETALSPPDWFRVAQSPIVG